MVVSIDKLMLWRVDSWKKYGPNECISMSLRILCDQLLITTESKVLETINMNEKIKGIYKGDVLVLFIRRTAQEIRKIKFQIKNNTDHCLELLNKYFPVVSHNSRPNNIRPRYRNIEEVLTYALNKKDLTSCTTDLPPSFKNFVKLCLLDPSFPKLVQETQKFLNCKINKNSDFTE
ncbi:unnamed protein product [Parnassius mnemosyne]|uniref:Uncharacterized protein n=1 Tax=Parnassius mnemosyne TaxID=213953 RepID=A0AAV1LFN6_9NEOP